MPDPDPTPRRSDAPGLQDLLQIGAVCGVMIGLGVFGGYLLDRVAGTSPLLTFVGLAFGILGAGTGAYAVIRPYLRSSTRSSSTPNPSTPGSDSGSKTKD